MNYRPIIKEVIKLLLLVSIPILLLVKFNWDSIILIVIYLQFILIWAQAEIGLRQHVLSSAKLDPSFRIKVEKEVDVIIDTKRPNKIIVSNISEYPAYNVFVGRILDKRYRSISPDKWKDKIRYEMIDCLPPDAEHFLCRVSDKVIANKSIIEVIYVNKFGDTRDFYIAFVEDGKIMFIPKRMKVPGILLNTFDNLVLSYKLLRYRNVKF